MIYLDHAATTPMRPEAIEAMRPFFADAFGNPSGIHATSRQAKNALEEARERAAAVIGADRPLDIVFTGGGTESDNLGVAGPALAGAGKGGVVTSAIEHEAVLETARFLGRLGCPVRIVGVESSGVIDPERVTSACDDATAVVSIMAANNETGAIQPVREVAEAVRGRYPGIVVHSDAVQAFVSVDVSVESLGADLVTIASHKFGGPKGVGLLAVRDGIELEPVLHGGGQEMGRRSGTHDVAGIVGMVAAMEAASADRSRFREQVGAARSAFESEIVAALGDVAITARDNRLVQHCHVHLRGVDAETLLIRLDGSGIGASAGSACQSGAIELSHVLEAMGVDAEAASQTVRFSFGWTTTADEAAQAGRMVGAIARSLR